MIESPGDEQFTLGVGQSAFGQIVEQGTARLGDQVEGVLDLENNIE